MRCKAAGLAQSADLEQDGELPGHVAWRGEGAIRGDMDTLVLAEVEQSVIAPVRVHLYLQPPRFISG